MACSAVGVSCSALGSSNRYGAQVQIQKRRTPVVCGALNRSQPKGFGQGSSNSNAGEAKVSSRSDSTPGISSSSSSSSSRPVREAEDDTVPEVVTNRMLQRMVFTVGIPLTFGLLAFPLYYYSKMILKMDVPAWLPMITSTFTFGAAGLGIAYAVMSSSWDPQRKGSLLGWNEALVNWELMWEKKVD